jgi:hypothetical protein
VYILTATIVLGLQSALIAGLMIQGEAPAHRARAAREGGELRRSSERNQDLPAV